MELGRDILTFIIWVQMLLLLWFLLFSKRNLGFHIEYFAAAIGATFSTEVIGKLMTLNGYASNHVALNIGINFFTFLFIFIYFYKILNSPKLKKLQFAFLGIFLLNYSINVLFISNFFDSFSTKVFFVNVLILMATCILYLFELFNSDEIFRIKQNYSFWISIGLIIIYLGLLPLILVASSGNSGLTMNIFKVIVFAINFVGYGIMLVGIKFSKKNRVHV